MMKLKNKELDMYVEKLIEKRIPDEEDDVPTACSEHLFYYFIHINKNIFIRIEIILTDEIDAKKLYCIRKDNDEFYILKNKLRPKNKERITYEIEKWILKRS